MPTSRPIATTVALAVVIALSAASCSDGSSGSTTTAAPTTSPSTSSTSAARRSTTTGPSATTTTSAPAAPCASGQGEPPAGAVTKTVPDVDGDGKVDLAWITGPGSGTGITTVGISTAAGGGASVPFQSASPIERSVLVVDVDRTGPVELIFSDGRGASLHAWVGCAIQPVVNPEGQTYAFDLGDRIGTGTGIGCVDTAEGRRLAGLQRLPEQSGSGATVRWSRTVIELDRLRARNGERTTGTYTSPADDAAIEALDQISCGSQTMAADGLHDPGA